MFNLFNNKDKHGAKEFHDLVLAIIRALPSRFHYLIDQVQEGIISGVRHSSGPIRNKLNFSHDVKLLNKYENKLGRFFKIKGIEVYDLQVKGYSEVNLFVAYGLVMGISTPGNEKFRPDISRIKVNMPHKQYLDENDFEKISGLFSTEESKLINPADVYEVELDGQTYFHLKALGDGDFIGMDNKRNIFQVTHDPFAIKRLDNQLIEILNTSPRK